MGGWLNAFKQVASATLEWHHSITRVGNHGAILIVVSTTRWVKLSFKMWEEFTKFLVASCIKCLVVYFKSKVYKKEWRLHQIFWFNICCLNFNIHYYVQNLLLEFLGRLLIFNSVNRFQNFFVETILFKDLSNIHYKFISFFSIFFFWINQYFGNNFLSFWIDKLSIRTREARRGISSKPCCFRV